MQVLIVLSLGQELASLKQKAALFAASNECKFLSPDNVARAEGFAAYIVDGMNRLPAIHRLDAAVLYLLVLESSPTLGITITSLVQTLVFTRQNAFAAFVPGHLVAEAFIYPA
jgi:hypothetical protein